jgi:cbb3-type cytochrome oxidase subunit 3
MIAALVTGVIWALFVLVLCGVGALAFFFVCLLSIWWLMRRARKRHERGGV